MTRAVLVQRELESRGQGVREHRAALIPSASGFEPARQDHRGRLSMNHTVRAMIMGGLGNQLFIYAAARALAVRTGGRLLLDLSRFRLDETYRRVFLLDRFPIEAHILRPGPVGRAGLLLERVIRKNSRLTRWADILVDPGSSSPSGLLEGLVNSPPRRSVTLDGYWQSDFYFRDAEDVVRRELTPPPPSCPVALRERAAIDAARHPVAVAIRFYREVPGTVVDPAAVIAPFRQALSDHHARHPEATYFVFTEEPGYFREPTCLGVPFTAVTPRPANEDAPTDLHLLTRCRTFFLSYSSFHWWGAWLSAAPGKAVYYLHRAGRPCRNYIPAGWEVLDWHVNAG